ncbi:MAG: hypothetical protein K2R98_01770 [Gemmataceae bacterium]|nr:hypothetical protein [Gemmataceae bacterium]
MALFQISLALAYIVVYSALEQDSPTLIIVTYVAAAGDAGRSPQDIHAIFVTSGLLRIRIQSILASNLAECSDGMVTLTPKGRFWAALFGGVRRVYGMDKGA